MKPSIYIAVLLLRILHCPCPAAPPDSVEARYLEARQKISGAFEEKSALAKQGYADGLGKLLMKYQMAGDLDNTVAISKEIDRFASEQNLDTPPGIQLPEFAIIIRDRARRQLNETNEMRVRQMGSLLSGHLKHLNAAQKQQTQAAEIEKAIQTKKEIDSLSTELTALRAEMAKIRAARPAPKPPAHRVPAPGVLPQIHRGLVGFYTFDRDGRHEIHDKSRNRNNGKVKGAQWTREGKRGGGLQVDFHDKYVELPAKMLKDAEALTLSVWVKMPQYAGGNYPSFIGGYTGNPDLHIGIGIQRDTGRLWLEVDTDQRNYWWGGSNSVPWDTWFHAALVYDGKTFVEYVNGEKGLVKDAPGKPKPLEGFYIGRKGPLWNPGSSTIGTLDNAMVFNRALTEKEVRQLYRSQR